MDNKRIFVFTIPNYSHINAIIGLSSELAKRNAKVTFFGIEPYRDRIVKAGLIYKSYPYFDLSVVASKSTFKLEDTVEIMLLSVEYWLPELKNIIISESPHLVIIDHFALYMKYLFKNLKYNYENGLSNYKPPPLVYFSPSFALKKDLYPSDSLYDALDFNHKKDPEFIRAHSLLISKQIEINEKYPGINILDPVEAFHNLDEDLSIISVFPELQPKVEVFDKSYKFVGCGLSDIRTEEVKDNDLRLILDRIMPINPVKSIDEIEKNGLKLLYCSLGSILNNFEVFEKIINAIKYFEDETSEKKSTVKSNQLMVILAVNYGVYEIFEEKIKKHEYNLPSNISIFPFVPQLEILKRASLFITHAGMNSINETIYYGVPTICIPICSDQPLIAHRICDDLKLGIRLNEKGLSYEKIRASIHDVFRDLSYTKNAIEFSKISRRYNGVFEACNLIENYIKDK